MFPAGRKREKPEGGRVPVFLEVLMSNENSSAQANQAKKRERSGEGGDVGQAKDWNCPKPHDTIFFT